MSTKKKIIWSVVAVLLIAVTVVCIRRWSVWFGEPEEPAYQCCPKPSRVLLTFGNSGELSRNISWTCGDELRESCVVLVDTLAKDTVEIKADGEVFESRAGKAAYYHVKLNNLKPNTVYRYLAYTNWVTTLGDCSDWYEFKTQSINNDHFSFLYVGDVQDIQGDSARAYFRQVSANNKDAEFLVCGGDFCERPIDAYWGELFVAIDSLCQSMPVMTVTGNHDYLKRVPRKLERRFSLIFSYFLESMVGENQVYTLKYNNLQLFFLDSDREFPYQVTQKNWLEEQLKKSDAKFKIVVTHHPIFSTRGKSRNMTTRWLMKDVLEDNGVQFVLQGHEHIYARMFSKVGDEPSLPMYSVSHCSPKNYSLKYIKNFDKIGSNERFYQKIYVNGDTLSMSAHIVGTNALYDSVSVVMGSDGNVKLLDFGKEIKENIER